MVRFRRLEYYTRGSNHKSISRLLLDEALLESGYISTILLKADRSQGAHNRLCIVSTTLISYFSTRARPRSIFRRSTILGRSSSSGRSSSNNNRGKLSQMIYPRAQRNHSCWRPHPCEPEYHPTTNFLADLGERKPLSVSCLLLML
jgi:hypothetical protein